MEYKKIILLFTCFIALTATLTKAEDLETQILDNELNTLLSKAEENFGRIKTIKTLLTQEKNLSLFSEKIISKGFCLFKAPDTLRLDFTAPFKSSLIVDNKMIHKYEYYDGAWHKLTPGNQEIMLMIMNNITSWLKGKFKDPDIYELKAYKGQNTKIVLIPKSRDFKNFITSFELGLNKEINGLDYIIINEKKNDYTKIMFHNDIIDSNIPKLIFSGESTGPQNVETW